MIALLVSVPLAISTGLVNSPPPLDSHRYVGGHYSPKAVQIGGAGSSSTICCDRSDWVGVQRAATDLQSDIERVTSLKPSLSLDTRTPAGDVLVIGTVGRSRLIDRLVESGKLDVSAIRGKWEAHLTQTLENPFPGTKRAVVVAGSDKRGTIYGTYEMSEQAGVSPWYWWCDVPIKHQDRLYVTHGRFIQKSPAVKYRGIFINDEAPSLSNWVYQNFGEYKHEFYAHVFELLLRLKANYLWPAMWNNCFSEDDPLNPKLADDYGIVMGTSHVEPMMRADKEWNRLGYNAGSWNFEKSATQLENFWRAGLERNKRYENIVTIAMRGKIDTPMSESANIALHEKIVATQRNLIANTVDKDVSNVPQLWALYKEVQEYYEKGMRVPDDVTLLWCDDNWGNIRHLPAKSELGRPGGAGVYYHFDYVGDPRNYKWVNTNPLPRIWEQMNIAYDRGARQIWIVNVGDLKPKEFPIEFFLKLGRDPKAWGASRIGAYTENWAAKQFGTEHSTEIGQMLAEYGKLNGRRKPELLDANTYSLVSYNEADRIVTEYNALAERADALYRKLPVEAKDAFFEIVLYNVKACANLNALYVAAAKNQLYAAQGRAAAAYYADEVKRMFDLDATLTLEYHAVHGGKWNHMMDQTHIGYTSWQQPGQNSIPKTTTPLLGEAGKLGVSLENSTYVLPDTSAPNSLAPISRFDNSSRWLDVFNRGKGDLSYLIEASDPWLHLSSHSGPLTEDVRVSLNVDWSRVPSATVEASLTVIGSDGSKVSVRVPIEPRTLPHLPAGTFIESAGSVSMNADHFTRGHAPTEGEWMLLPDLGREASSVTFWPASSLEYPIYTWSSGEAKLHCFLSPTQNLQDGPGLRFAISLDGETPQVVNMHEGYDTAAWRVSVADNIRQVVSTLHIPRAGLHTVKFWAIDPCVVLQKLVLDFGGVRQSYLGPPESFKSSASEKVGRR